MALLESMPGVGKVRAKQIMERLGIAENRRVRGLGTNQRAALEAEFARRVASVPRAPVIRRTAASLAMRLTGHEQR